MIDPSRFIPGLRLSELFYQEAVKPVLDEFYPRLPYSAALLGDGSEVLGFDTPQSMDHHWGPRMQLFLKAEDVKVYAEEITSLLSQRLPHTFRGFSTSFGEPDQFGVRPLIEVDSGAVSHRVEVTACARFFSGILGLDISGRIIPLDWLTLPEQQLLSVTAGKVFYDGLQELAPIRDKLAYYPHEIWLYLLSCQWTKISQEEAFVGRCAAVGDEIGSKVEAARIVSFLMKLCFLMEKKYAPYPKWFGTAFSKLKLAEELSPVLDNALSAKAYPEREASLAQAYELAAKAHNSLRITPPLHTQVSFYYERPYRVIHAGIFAQEIKKQIKDRAILEIASRNIGSIDQFVDSTDVLAYPELFEKLKPVYRK